MFDTRIAPIERIPFDVPIERFVGVLVLEFHLRGGIFSETLPTATLCSYGASIERFIHIKPLLRRGLRFVLLASEAVEQATHA